MPKQLEPIETPEQIELEAKLHELASVEADLAQKELDLATLTADLQSLESQYLRIVGAKLLELDRVRAEIAETIAANQPKDQVAQEDAKQARARAEQTAQETGDTSKPRKIESFQATPELKDLYRRAAKKAHPDLAVDEKDRERRTRVMAEINKAYKEGDAARLQAILSEWEASPESIPGEDIGARLIRTIRMIAQARRRLSAIDQEIAAIKQSDLYQLKVRVEEAAKEGRDLFAEMAQAIERQILDQQATLEEIKARFR